MNYYEQSCLEMLEAELTWQQIPYTVKDFDPPKDPTDDLFTMVKDLECYSIESVSPVGEQVDHFKPGDEEWIELLSATAKQLVEEAVWCFWEPIEISVKSYQGIKGTHLKICCRDGSVSPVFLP
jgi:hypothetical protein